MEQKRLKKMLACYSIAGLLSTVVLTAGCSQQENKADKQEDQETSQQQSGIVDENSEKSGKPDGTEIQIRGKSG